MLMFMKILLSTIMLVLFVGCDNKKGTFIETVQSQNSHEVSTQNLKMLIKNKGLRLFHLIDHKSNADAVKMNLKPETVIVFGNPKMGTTLMNCNSSMGLELPLRILVSTDYEGITTFSYTNPEYWSLKHNIKDKQCLAILIKAKTALHNLCKAASQRPPKANK